MLWLRSVRKRSRGVPKRLAIAIHRFAARFRLHVLPVHFYSSLPDIVELAGNRKFWARKSTLPGIATDLDTQVELGRWALVTGPRPTRTARSRTQRIAMRSRRAPTSPHGARLERRHESED